MELLDFNNEKSEYSVGFALIQRASATTPIVKLNIKKQFLN